MEDALVRIKTSVFTRLYEVLILVLMEDALVQTTFASHLQNLSRVLILVLMEDALVPHKRG